MKRLIGLISTQGKSPEQVAKEVMTAYRKYKRVSKQVSRKSTVEKP